MIDIYKNVSDVEFLVWNIQPVEKGRCRTELTASKDDFTELHNNQLKLFSLVKQIYQQGRIHNSHPVFRFSCLPVSPAASPHVLLSDIVVFSVFCTSCLRDGLTKKIAVLLDCAQMRGGRALPKFFVHFSQTLYTGSIWGWGAPAQIVCILAFKKSGTSCPN